MTQAKQKKLSAKERYDQIRAKNAERVVDKLNEVLNTPLEKDEPVFDHISPSGMEWKLRRPNLRLFLDAGLMPTYLAMKIAVIQKETKNPLAVLDKLNAKEFAQSVELNSAIIRYVAVEPRIVESPTSDDEIGFDDVLQIDYDDLLKWATTGGDEAERLGNFPTE